MLYIVIICFLSACNQQNSEAYENVREVVWEQIAAEELNESGFYNKGMWGKSSVEKVNLEDKYTEHINVNYTGKEIFLVFLDDKDANASPTFLVNQSMDRVIGVIPGE